MARGRRREADGRVDSGVRGLQIFNMPGGPRANASDKRPE